MQAGCALLDNSTLAFQECLLLANSNCTLAPTVVARGAEEGVDSLQVSGAQLGRLSGQRHGNQ